MDQSMEKHSGIRVPIKIKEKDKALPNMNPELAKHWDEYDSYNPAAERHVEPRLTDQFVDGYSAYQERVGQAVRQHHELTFEGTAKLGPINLSIRDKLNQELDPQKFAKLELERLKVRATS
jgi:hypothetical protein